MKVRESSYDDGGTVRKTWGLWCPGCDSLHQISDAWEVRLPDDDHLTVSPSILTWSDGRYPKDPATGEWGEWDPTPWRCHSFIRDGRWEFLTDSTHHLAGQTVPMVDLPDWIT